MKKILSDEFGQALVTLLFIAVIGLTIISAAAIFVFQNVSGASDTEQGVDSYYVAEAGIQEGLIRLIRNASYSGTLAGQPISVGTGSVTIAVTGSTTSATITSTGTYNKTVRKIQVQTVYNNGIYTISSWKEIN